MRIEPQEIGFPASTGTELLIRVISFDTTATTYPLYYEIKNDMGQVLATGNVNLIESEFDECRADNTAIENMALTKLGLERYVE